MEFTQKMVPKLMEKQDLMIAQMVHREKRRVQRIKRATENRKPIDDRGIL